MLARLRSDPIGYACLFLFIGFFVYLFWKDWERAKYWRELFQRVEDREAAKDAG